MAEYREISKHKVSFDDSANPQQSIFYSLYLLQNHLRQSGARNTIHVSGNLWFAISFDRAIVSPLVDIAPICCNQQKME